MKMAPSLAMSGTGVRTMMWTSCTNGQFCRRERWRPIGQSTRGFAGSPSAPDGFPAAASSGRTGECSIGGQYRCGRARKDYVFYLCGLVLTACLVLGGSTYAGFLSDAILQLLSIPLLLLAIWQMPGKLSGRATWCALVCRTASTDFISSRVRTIRSLAVMAACKKLGTRRSGGRGIFRDAAPFGVAGFVVFGFAGSKAV